MCVYIRRAQGAFPLFASVERKSKVGAHAETDRSQFHFSLTLRLTMKTQTSLALLVWILSVAVVLSRTDNDLPPRAGTVATRPEESPPAVTSPPPGHELSPRPLPEDDEDYSDYDDENFSDEEDVDYEMSGASEGRFETEHLMAAVRAGPTLPSKPPVAKGKKGKKTGEGKKKGKGNKKGKGKKKSNDGKKKKKTEEEQPKGESQTRGHFSECPDKDYCVQGTCRFADALQEPQCICHAGYMGMRCESVILPVTKEETNLHTRTIALAALVISCLALIVCAVTSILFSRRSKRRRDMDLESLTGKYRDGRN
ncbi:uncharacterized protein LOC144732100 isoform X1 [Lampetra planeri]